MLFLVGETMEGTDTDWDYRGISIYSFSERKQQTVCVCDKNTQKHVYTHLY